MAKKTPVYVCSDCGEDFGKWLGQCPNCQNWNTLKEWREPQLSGTKTTVNTGQDLTKAKKSADFLVAHTERLNTNINEVDRVLGGGFFPGSVILFGGHPGIGKSTLALQIFLEMSEALYFSGEESVQQVANRANRLADKESADFSDRIFTTNSLEDIITTISQTKPPFVVIDSIQMVGLANSTFGTTTQIKENAEVLVKLAKSSHTTILLIGHVTKADELAGPKILEHMVDVVLRLEGETTSEIRLLRSPKNRFGSTLEVGVFDMQTNGLQELKNPSEFFLAERAVNAFGSCISVLREGSRNFLLEIQTLTLKTNFGQPRRTSHGVDLSKFHLLLAVVSKFTPLKCHEYDAYLNVVGGLKIKEPAADLAIVASILGSRLEKEIPADTVIVGEVGLSGEVRSVTYLENRLTEAAKLGFKRAIVPMIRKEKLNIKGLKIIEVKTISALIKAVF